MSIHPTAIIEDNVEIGPDCEIGAYAVIKRFTRIGARNRIFEHAVIGGEPQDVKFKGEPSALEIGDDNIFANEVALAGHITIEDHVFLSNGVGAHQFVRMGRHAMIGGKSKIVLDVLPFFITDGNPPRVRGVNSVGLRRSGFNEDARRALKDAYRILFRSALPLQNALQTLDELEDEHVTHLVNFIRGSKRGFVRAEK
jgi:UDP-N-acetylglucosamine acyltransferase